ncbi:MAG: hypothetical protein R3D32_04540 [Nitratireductor sp.]
MRGSFLALLALVAIWAGLPSGNPDGTLSHAGMNSSGNTPVWLVSGTTDCRVGLEGGSSGFSQIVLSGECNDAPVLLLRARSWKPEAADSVAMLDDTGNEIIRFGSDEQGGLISISPRSVLVGLSPASSTY